MSFLAARSVKRTLRRSIYEKLLRDVYKRQQQIVIVVLRPVSGRSDYSIHAAFPGKTDKLNPICFGVVL